MFKLIVAKIIINIPTIILSFFAFLLAKNGIDGWGWFLFAAFCFVSSIECTSKD